ncbi:hypothetical protein, partial [Streptomyces sp. NPDC004721]
QALAPGWHALLRALERHPTRLSARTLSTPWRLCLARTAHATEGDPAELLKHTSARSLDAHLLAP